MEFTSYQVGYDNDKNWPGFRINTSIEFTKGATKNINI